MTHRKYGVEKDSGAVGSTEFEWGEASPLVESVEPLSERVFVNTPLTTNLESRQIFAVDHPLQGAPGYLQQLSGFFDR